MNHFTNDVAKNTDAQANPSAASLPPVEVETTLQQIEANIRQLTENAADQSIAPSSNFDALDYATLTSAPRAEEFGEADPYVNPVDPDVLDSKVLDSKVLDSEVLDSEVVNSATTDLTPDSIPPAKTIDEIMQKLSGYQSENESIESIGPNQSNRDSESLTINPANDSQAAGLEVEVIAESEITDSQNLDNDSIPGTESNLEQTDVSSQEDSATPAWLSDAVAALNEFAITKDPIACSQKTEPNMAVPLVNASTDDDQEFGEAVFDVRDFSEAASGVIEPIPGTQEVEPDFFEFHVIEKLKSDQHSTTADPESRPSPSATESSVEIEPADPVSGLQPAVEPETHLNTEDQLIVADNGDVIQIDGEDGFGYIDLACFDVQHATFQEQVIKIDADEGTVFEIHHRNIPYALFADGVEVDLTPDELGEQIEEK